MKLLSFSLCCLAFSLNYGSACAAIAHVNHHDNQIVPNDAAACIECHDDMEVERSKHHPIGIGLPKMRGKQQNEEMLKGGKRALFKSQVEAEKSGIRFFNGFITCLSCHDLLQSAANHLIIHNKGSNLCVSCHKM